MKNIIHFFCMAIAVVTLQSCEKELDIKYKDIDPIPVIEGCLTEKGARVRITMTTPMDEPMDSVALTDATVTLTDLTEGDSETLIPDRQGNFISSTGGVPGHVYELNVKRGTSAYTSSCVMTEPTEILDLEFNWIKMPYDHVAVLQVSFSDNLSETAECYWVRLYRNGKAYMWNLITDIYASDGVISDIFMTSRKDLDEEEEDTILREGDVVSASVTPISREMYDYLEAVSSDSNGPRLFAGDFCLGYFLAAPVAESSIVFHPDQIAEY